MNLLSFNKVLVRCFPAEGSFGKVVSLVMSVGQQAELEVEFSPRNTRTFEATIRLVVADNLFEETEVQLLGESYQDIVTLDNILSKGLESTNSKSLPLDLNRVLTIRFMGNALH